MFPEIIRGLDGKDLTELAHRLGLAPDNVMTVWDNATETFLGCWYYNTHGEPIAPWTPHETLSTAEICFRALRLRDWKTRVEGTTRAGAVWADQAGGRNGVLVTWPSPHAATEPHALLLASVLAVAQEKENIMQVV